MTELVVIIRPAEPALAEAIHALLVACGRDMKARGLRSWDPPPASPESIRAETTGEIVLAALTAGPAADGGEVVGSVTVRSAATHDYAPDVGAGRVRWRTAPDASPRYMNRLAVHPAWQRNGVGGRLMAAAEQAAREAGAAALRFDVLAANEELVRWYAQRGCTSCGRRRHSGKDFVVMEKPL